jgi:hypothetical protein
MADRRIQADSAAGGPPPAVIRHAVIRHPSSFIRRAVIRPMPSSGTPEPSNRHPARSRRTHPCQDGDHDRALADRGWEWIPRRRFIALVDNRGGDGFSVA